MWKGKVLILVAILAIQMDLISQTLSTNRAKMNKVDLELNWSQFVNSDSSFVGSFVAPVIHDDHIIFTYFIGEINGEQWIQKVGKKSGELDLKLQLKSDKGSVKTFQLWKDKLFIGYAAGYVECLNVTTLDRIWEYDAPGMNPFFTVEGDELFLTIRVGPKPFILESQIVKININTGDVKPIVKVSREEVNEGSPFVHSPVKYRSSSSDEIIYFAIESIFESGVEVHFWAFNITTGKYIWKQNTVDSLTVQIDPPIIFENTITLIGTKAMTFDLENGILLADLEIPREMHRMTRPLKLDNKLFIKGLNTSLVCIDLDKQSIVWENKNAGGWSEHDLKNFDGKLFYCGLDGSLYIVNKSTGEVLQKGNSPLEKSSFGIGGHVLDKEEGHLFFMDNSKIISLRL